MSRYPGVRKRGKVWYVNYRAGGRRIEERAIGAATAEEADVYRTERRRAAARGEWKPQEDAELDQVGASSTVKDLTGWYRAHVIPTKRGQQFQASACDVIDKALGRERLRAVSPARIERWIAELRLRGCGDSTVRKYTGVLRRAWRTAAESPTGRKHVAGIPCPVDAVKLPREPKGQRKAVPADGLRRLLAAADEGPPHLGRWVRLILYMGLRVEEARNLTAAAVDLQRGVVYPDGKTGERAVPIPRTLLRQVKAWTLAAGEGPIIGTVPESPYRAIRTMFRRAGLAGVSLRNLRTTFVRIARDEGVDLADLADVDGHSLDTLRAHYADASDAARRAVVETVARAIGGRVVARKKR